MDLAIRIQQCFESLRTIDSLTPEQQDWAINIESPQLLGCSGVSTPTKNQLRTERDRAIAATRREP